MTQSAIETGLRWGGLIALRPRHVDLEHGRLTVTETIVEIPSRRTEPTTRQHQALPQSRRTRTMGPSPEILDQLRARIQSGNLGPGTCCSRSARIERVSYRVSAHPHFHGHSR